MLNRKMRKRSVSRKRSSASSKLISLGLSLFAMILLVVAQYIPGFSFLNSQSANAEAVACTVVTRLGSHSGTKSGEACHFTPTENVAGKCTIDGVDAGYTIFWINNKLYIGYSCQK